MAFFNRQQKWSLLVCFALPLFLSSIALAQSGRRKDPPQAPPIVVPPLPQPPPVHSILVIGHSIDDADTKELWSNYRGTITKSCIKKLLEQPGPQWQASDGGKVSRKEAHESAGQQKDTYLLWIGYRMVRPAYLLYVDFLLLAPQTGLILMKGRIDPNESVVRRSPLQVRLLGDQLEDAGRLVAERVRAKF